MNSRVKNARKSKVSFCLVSGEEGWNCNPCLAIRCISGVSIYRASKYRFLKREDVGRITAEMYR